MHLLDLSEVGEKTLIHRFIIIVYLMLSPFSDGQIYGFGISPFSDTTIHDHRQHRGRRWVQLSAPSVC